VTLSAKDVAEISRLLEESAFDELCLELDGLKLTLRRRGAPMPPPPLRPEERVPPPPQPGRSGPAAPHESSGGGGPQHPAPAPAIAAREAGSDITAPLLGTFYRAPKPGAPPFVEVGSVVEEDTIIGIIEVMKLMNTVRAGRRGRVVAILARDGALVEYGETLMRLSGEARA
jgi:acetyl-CoA carboxylase biotin carboxyl carrier protein